MTEKLILWVCLIGIISSLAISIVSLIQSNRSKRSNKGKGKPGSNGLNGLNGSNGSTGSEGATGSQGLQGQQGPALFTLLNLQGQATLGSNSIATDPDTASVIDVIRTIETYPTSFLTFRFASFDTITNPMLMGFVNTNNINTFAFGFQFDDGNVLSVVANQSGSVPMGSYSEGDILTVVVTSANYLLIQNGLLIASGVNSVPAGGSYYASFYLPNPNVLVDLISFGYQTENAVA